MSACGVIPQPRQLISQLIGYFDCQASAIATYGFAGLAAPGSLGAMLLTIAVTIMIALFGYRLMLGGPSDRGELVSGFVRLGLVLALATGFAAFNQLGVRAILDGPAELARSVVTSAALSDQPDALATQLDAIDQGFRAFAFYGPGAQPADDLQALYEPSPWPGFDNFAAGISRVIFVVTAVAASSVPKLFAGILLAAAPVVLLLLLFERSAWLVLGWLRMLAAAAIASMAGIIILAIEAQLLSFWLADLVNRRMVDETAVGAHAALLAVATIFAILTLLSVSWSAKLATAVTSTGAHWHARLGATAAMAAPVVKGREDIMHSQSRSDEAAIAPNRARRIANAAAAQTDRERLEPAMADRGAGQSSSGSAASPFTHQPGYGFVSRYGARRTSIRRSSASQRRALL